MSSLRFWPLLFLPALGCGSNAPPPPAGPTAGAVRDFWGLGPGSCWKYRYRPSGAATDLFSSVTVSDPDTVRISGHTVYVVTFQPQASQPNEYLLDVDATPGEIRLARTVERPGGMPAVTKTYLADPRPLWAKFKFDAQKKLDFTEVQYTTAAKSNEDMADVQHQWVVVNKMEMAATPDGPQAAIKLSYNRSDAGLTLYWLVPGFGMAQFTDAMNTPHQVCAARVCDQNGACTGASACDSLVCP